MNTSLLYVEDGPFLARIVQDGLRQSGYAVTWVADGEQAQAAFRAQPFDLCVLDVLLPTRNGYSLAEAIRAEALAISIIFLSAKALTEDVVRGFRSGGNDYLHKPFSMEELLVRIEALLRPRPPLPTSPVAPRPTTHYFGACALDPVHQKLHTPFGAQQLSYKETALLELLLQRRNQVLERRTALRTIWGADTHYHARIIYLFISYLRKLLRVDPAIKLLTLRGLGYKLLC